ncbi:hypothetical protein TcCL_NonESM07038 [Trypanosoma cruzi]|nr:hypothetical protein TcCL_NonESM07038 [Trypanosoma cruzi]
MSSEHHSDTPRHAKENYSSPQCTSPHNHIAHAPRTSAAHTPSNKCSSDRCYPRAAVGIKQTRRAAKPQKSAATGRNSTERSHTNEFSPHALNLPPSPQKPSKLTSNILFNKLTVRHQMKPSGVVVVTFTGTGSHLLFTTTLNTCNGFFGNASLLPNQKTPTHHRRVTQCKERENSSHRHQSRPHYSAISRGWAQRLVRPSTPCNPALLDASTLRFTTAAR